MTTSTAYVCTVREFTYEYYLLNRSVKPRGRSKGLKTKNLVLRYSVALVVVIVVTMVIVLPPHVKGAKTCTTVILVRACRLRPVLRCICDTMTDRFWTRHSREPASKACVTASAQTPSEDLPISTTQSYSWRQVFRLRVIGPYYLQPISETQPCSPRIVWDLMKNPRAACCCATIIRAHR